MTALTAVNMNTAINAVVVLASIAYFGWRGYQRGVLRTLQRLLSIIAGYVACYFFTETLAGFLKVIFSLHVFTAYLISAALLLCGVTFIVNLALSRFITHHENGSEEEETSETDYDTNVESDEEDQPYGEPTHPAGMMVGALLGCFMGLITVWLAAITMDAVTLNRQGATALVPGNADPVRKMAGDMVGGVLAYALEQKTGHNSLAPDLLAHLIADPVAMSQQIAEVSKSDEMKQFFSDPSVRQLMQENRVDELERNDAFLKLMHTPQTRIFFAVLGSSVKDGATMTQESRAAHLLTDMYRRAKRVQTDPRFISLSEKPEFQQLLQNPSAASLLTSPLLKELGDIMFSTPPAAVSANTDKPIPEGTEQDFQSVAKPQWEKVQPIQETSSGVTSDDAAATPDAANVIYRWTDEHGQKHFSQTRPEGDYALEIIKTQ